MRNRMCMMEDALAIHSLNLGRRSPRGMPRSGGSMEHAGWGMGQRLDFIPDFMEGTGCGGGEWVWRWSRGAARGGECLSESRE